MLTRIRSNVRYYAGYDDPAQPYVRQETNPTTVTEGWKPGAIASGFAKNNVEVLGKDFPLPPSMKLSGSRNSIFNKALQPGEEFQSSPGTLVFMSRSIEMKARFAGFRFFTGEGLAKLQYVNPPTSAEIGYIGLTPNQPMAIIIPFDVGKDGGLNCKLGAFMAGDSSVRVYPKMLPAASLGACACGGMPPVIQQVSGHGYALITAGGTAIRKTLNVGETILVDSHSVVAFTDNVTYDVKQVGNLATCCCGGEGCFNTQLTGPGVVFMESMASWKLTKLLMQAQGPGAGANNEKQGSSIGGGPDNLRMIR